MRIACSLLQFILPPYAVVLVSAAGTPARGEELNRIEPGSIRVGGEIGRRFDITIRNNLLAIDIDEVFLAPFRDRDRKGGFVGLGMLIDAVVRFAASTRDEELNTLKQHIIDETLKTQEDDGYIGLMVPESRVWSLWDIHEMSYLVYGLSMDHRFFGEKRSQEAASRLAGTIMNRWSSEPEGIPGKGSIAVHMAVTGLETAFLALSDETGDPRYREFCVGFRNLGNWDLPIVRGRWGKIEGHIYAYLCRCLAQLRLFRSNPDPGLLSRSERVLEFLTGEDGLTVAGSTGYHECWDDTHNGGDNHAETCATAYWIRFLDELLRQRGDSRYGDLMERSIYNGLFAAQSPDGRRIRYYTPFETTREYFSGDAYCCPNNYRRIVSELPGFIYYRTNGGIVVNLYTESRVTVTRAPGKKVTIRQETDYPHSGKIILKIDPSEPMRFPLSLRIPTWCPKPEIRINKAKAREKPKAGTFFTLDREWREGDSVEIDFPMPLRLVRGRKAQAGRVAVMRGPLVFGLNPKRNPDVRGVDLRMITLDPGSAGSVQTDDTVHTGGSACPVRAWKPKAWYPAAKTDYRLTLTEYADPGIRQVFFLVPNPYGEDIIEDELIDLFH